MTECLTILRLLIRFDRFDRTLATRHKYESIERDTKFMNENPKYIPLVFEFHSPPIAMHTKKNEFLSPSQRTTNFAERKVRKNFNVNRILSRIIGFDGPLIDGGSRGRSSICRLSIETTQHYPWHWKSLAHLCVWVRKEDFSLENGHIRPEFFLPAKSKFRRETIFRWVFLSTDRNDTFHSPAIGDDLSELTNVIICTISALEAEKHSPKL